MLRDRLVCGLHDAPLQRRLLAEPDLTFTKALAIAVAAETAGRDAQALRLGLTPSTSQIQHIGAKSKFQYKMAKKGKNDAKGESSSKPCFRCGDAHAPSACRHIETICRYCKKKGHIDRVCFSKARDAKVQDKKQNKHSGHGATHQLDTVANSTFSGMPYDMNSLSPQQDLKRFTVSVRLDGKPHVMEVDSGAAFTIISEDTFRNIWRGHTSPLQQDPIALRTWTQETLDILGTFTTMVEFRNQEHFLPVLVVKGNGASLLGRNWFSPLGIRILGIQSAETPDYDQVFADGLGTYTGPPVTVEVDPAVKPVYMKPRPVPYALREKVEKELDRLVSEGVLEPVTHSDWATPIVPVLKKDGKIRICGDYRATVNKAIKVDTYPLPTTSELLAALAGGKKFSKLDMSEAYLQLPVDEETSRLLTWTTQKGLFRVKRLPFGISSAPSIFQRVMDQMLAGITGVGAYLDDVLIAGENTAQLVNRETETLTKINNSGLRLKRSKCISNTDSVEFLGFLLDADGVHPTDDKVAAIHNAPTPKNKEELQSFLGLLNFYSCFLPKKATVLEPLHRLLDKNSIWKWTKPHNEAFQAAKQLLKSSTVLVHYNPELPLTLACDASSYGVGAVLSHVIFPGIEKPIAFASRTLTRSERNYSQVQKEALSLIFGVQKFHNYVYGRKFTIVTDHKPLLGLFHPTRAMPQVMSPQMLRWSLILSAYAYELEYRPGSRHCNADAMSRLPQATPDFDTPPLGDILLLESTPDIAWDAKRIGALSRKDLVLSRVTNWVLQGFPTEKQEEQFAPFVARRNELSVHKNCLLWGSRVVIPKAAQGDILKLLHDAHPGIVRMKLLARSYVWWPRIDQDIQDCVDQCESCQLTRNNPVKAPVIPWESQENPWSRLHVDFAGPYKGKLFFLVVDSYSKWLDVSVVSSMTAKTVTTKLRELFATHGLPDMVVSDNAAVFCSSEYLDFLQRNGIRAVRGAPYHPSTNGQVERYVQIAKQGLAKILDGDWPTNIARFLFHQHVTPSTTTGLSPSEMLMGRRLKTVFDRVHPDHCRVPNTSRESSGTVRQFAVGDSVYARNYTNDAKWVPATITEQTGPLSYVVRTSDGRMWRRHVDQLRRRHSTISTSQHPPGPPCEEISLPEQAIANPNNEPDDDESASSASAARDSPITVRRSTRLRSAPLRFKDFFTHHAQGGGGVMYCELCGCSRR